MIGVVGTGAMGTAIIKGIIASNILPKNDIYAIDLNKDMLASKALELGFNISENIGQLVNKCKYIIVAAKPNVYDKILLELKDKAIVLITIAAGYEIKRARNIIGDKPQIIRTMPNTPAQILEGVVGYCVSTNVEKENEEFIVKLFSSFSKVVKIEEKLMHIFGAISGSIPALVDIFIEACADAAVLEGMPRNLAYEILSYAVSGSARMIGELEEHPAKLKDLVTSPGGTTIEGVKALELNGFRGALIEAIIAMTEKSEKM